MNRYSNFLIGLGLFCAIYGLVTEPEWGIYWMFTGFLCVLIVVITDLIMTPEWNIRRKKTYLALYEYKDAHGYHIEFTTLIRKKPPKLEKFLFRVGTTGRVIIFEVKEIPT